MSTNDKVIVFGELLMRLETPRFERFLQARQFNIGFTGAETNASVSLVNYGIPCEVISAVPAHDIGQACINYLRQYGLGTQYIQRIGQRLGIFYVETGASQRPSKVVYDRGQTSIQELRVGQIPWDDTFSEAGWFHFSGTAPALSPDVADVVAEACQAAQRAGVTVSCDLNYRSKLWSPSQASAVMTPLMEHVDVLIGNEEDASKIFGIVPQNVDIQAGKLSAQNYYSVLSQLQDRFDLRYVATTLRESRSASQNAWSGLLYDGQQFYESKRYEIQIVDRIGAGDAFSGGLIFGLLSGWEPGQSLEFAVAASCLKHTIHGDFNLANKNEVLDLVHGDASGRVQR